MQLAAADEADAMTAAICTCNCVFGESTAPPCNQRPWEVCEIKSSQLRRSCAGFGWRSAGIGAVRVASSGFVWLRARAALFLSRSRNDQSAALGARHINGSTNHSTASFIHNSFALPHVGKKERNPKKLNK